MDAERSLIYQAANSYCCAEKKRFAKNRTAMRLMATRSKASSKRRIVGRLCCMSEVGVYLDHYSQIAQSPVLIITVNFQDPGHIDVSGAVGFRHPRMRVASGRINAAWGKDEFAHAREERGEQ